MKNIPIEVEEIEELMNWFVNLKIRWFENLKMK
jgi:hypothetical protein